MRDLPHRCLAKDRRQRLHDIGDARLELEFAETGPDASTTTEVPRSKWKTPLLTGALGLATGAVLMWAIGLTDSPAPLPGPVTRFSQALPAGAPLLMQTVPGSALAITRDGRELIYSAGLRLQPPSK